MSDRNCSTVIINMEVPREIDIRFKNPLMNELIIQNLFKFLTINELTTCRSVCSLWNYEANLSLKARKCVNFSGSNVKLIYSFLKLTKSHAESSGSSSHPFGRFSTQIWDSESYRSRTISLPDYTEAFFKQHGQFIKYLQLSFNDFIDTMTMPKFRDWFIGTLKDNLGTLELNGLSSHISDKNSDSESIFDGHVENVQILSSLHTLILTDFFVEEELEVEPDGNGITKARFSSKFITDLLTMTPHLTSLTVNTFDNLRSSLSSAVIIEGLPKVLQKSCHLRNLHLQTYINEQQLKSINFCDFKLTRCEMKYVDTRTVRLRTLEKFFKAQSGTLRAFTIGIGIATENTVNDELPFDFKFPTVMNQLVTLNISSIAATKPIQFYMCPSHQEYRLPALQKLSLNNYTILRECCLHEVKISSMQFPAGFNDDVLFTTILMNWKLLMRLKLVAPTHSLLKLLWSFGSISNVECLELVLDNDLEIEPVLTGIAANVLQSENENRDRDTGNLRRDELSILNLTKLRKLVITDLNPENTLNLTDLTIFTTLCRIKCLTSLIIKNSKVSDVGRNFVKDSLSLLCVEIT